MLKLFTLLMTLLFCAPCFAAQKREELLTDLDIPLARGLVEDAGARVMFDSPAGRIVTAEARGKTSPEKVLNFYRIVLPSLGWKIITEGKAACKNQNARCIKARRDKENLSISIENQPVTKVTYSLIPQ